MTRMTDMRQRQQKQYVNVSTCVFVHTVLLDPLRQRWKNPHIQDPRKSPKMNQKVAKKLESECNCKKVAKSPRGR